MENTTSNIPADSGGNAPSNAEEQLSPRATFLKKWVVYRLPTLFAWGWLVFRISGWTLPIEQRVENYFVFPYLIAFILLVLTGRWLLAFGYPFYFVFSPILIIFEPIAFIIRTFITSSEGNPKWVKTLGKFVAFVRSFKAIIILFLLAAVAWVATALYVAPINRPILALVAHIITYILFLQSFRWAANPYRPILLGLGLMSRAGESLIRKIIVEPNLKKRVEERDSSYQTCDLILQGLLRLHDPEAQLTHGITSITHGSLAAFFTGFFFLMYLFVATSFTFSLYEIENGWGKIISGLGDTPDRMSYFYLSFLSQATAIPDGIQPLGHAGQVWIIWMVMTGLLLLTGLITLFTSAAGVYSDSTLSEVDRLFEEMTIKVQICQEELAQTPDPQ